MKVYTVIPKALGKIETWPKKIPHAFSKSTDVILLQPITKEGPSMSPYSADDYFTINSKIANSIDQVIETGLKHEVGIGIDLVYNHIHPQSKMVKKNPQWIQKNQDKSMKVAGCYEGYNWKSWDDLVLWDHTQEEVQDMAIEYARMWAKIPQETGGVIRIDNLHSSDKTITKKIIKMVEEEFPDVHITGECLADESTLRDFQNMGVNSFLGMQYYQPFCNDVMNFLENIHQSNIPYFLPISSHDSQSPSESYGTVHSTIPRYAISALMNNSNMYGITMWNEYGHPNKVTFIGKNIPTKPHSIMNFDSYFSAIDERVQEFRGDITLESNGVIIHAQRNNHHVFVNMDTKKHQEYGPFVTLPPCGVLIDNTLFYEKNGIVIEEKY